MIRTKARPTPTSGPAPAPPDCAQRLRTGQRWLLVGLLVLLLVVLAMPPARDAARLLIEHATAMLLSISPSARAQQSLPTPSKNEFVAVSEPLELDATGRAAGAVSGSVRLGGTKLPLLLLSRELAAHHVSPLRADKASLFQRLCAGELEVVATSAPITSAALQNCKLGSRGFIELPLAYAGVAVIENYANVWADPLTIQTLFGALGDAHTAPARSWNQLGPYVNADSATTPAVAELVTDVLEDGVELSDEPVFMPLQREAYQRALAKLDASGRGSVFPDRGSRVPSLDDILDGR